MLSRHLTLLLVFLLSLAFSCNGNYTLELPAFLGNGKGMLIPVYLSLSPGSEVILNLSVEVGPSTVESIREAYSYALSHSSKDCAITISFPRDIEKVDGPSGGAFLATAFTLILTNPKLLSLLDGVAITGAVDEEGHLYPVGGLYEKAKAALQEGRSVFIAPITTRLEAYLLDSLEGLTYYSAFSVADVLGALRGEEEPGAAELWEELLEEPNGSIHTIPFFEPLYKRMAQRYLLALEELQLEEPYHSYYERVFNHSERVAEKGYYYTAANELFLKLSELYALSSFHNRTLVDSLYGKVEECLSNYTFPNYTTTSYEWAGASIIRYYRAKAAYEALGERERSSTLLSLEEAYTLAEVYSWCLLAHDMASMVKGPPMDESPLKEKADELLLQLKGQEVEGLIPYALEEYSKGNYLTTIYLLRPLLWEDAGYYNNESLWYLIYHSQALYTGDEDLESYARVYGSIAKDVEEALSTITVPSQSSPPQTPACWGQDGESLLSLAFLFFLLFYIAWYHGRGGAPRSA